MKLKRFMEINHITDLREFFQNNMILGRGPVAFYSCPKCDDLVNDSSDINTHVCTPEEELKQTDGRQGMTLVDIPIKLEAIEKGFKITSKRYFLDITTEGYFLPPEFIKSVVDMCKDIYKEGFEEAADILTNKKSEEVYKKVEHTWYICGYGQAGCMFCDGGLGSCTVCNGFEGTLTEECCGFRLDRYVLEAVYKGGLNYARGEWTVTPKEKTK